MGLIMELQIQPQAEEDLEENVEQEDMERVLNKIDEVETRLEQGLDPKTSVEKRLSKGWSPMLQQRAGDYRIWFVEGEKTSKGDENTVYCVRVLTKDKQMKLMGVEINPEIYL